MRLPQLFKEEVIQQLFIMNLSKFLYNLFANFYYTMHYDVDFHFRVFEGKCIVKTCSSGSRYSEGASIHVKSHHIQRGQ